ncbi:unnamed protein product [Mycena citricolor]|uniref:Uncharacterized protein n=1 Tax=Mycena citricolor TaxID=2018698 RepID=A0AAD2HN38_9AGAR|nr:unnamed protein product [Mycena citricolor]
MPASANLKETAPAFCLFKVPSGNSKADFDSQLDEFATKIAQLPTVQKNWAALELVVQNSKLDESIVNLGLPAPQQYGAIITQAHSNDHCAELSNDPSMQEAIAAAANSGALADSCVFSADLHTTVHIPEADERTHVFGVFKTHPEIPIPELHARLERLMDSVMQTVPAAKANLVQHSLWFPKTDAVSDHIRTAGFEAPKDDIFVVILETEDETMDKLVELIQDQTFQNAITNGLQDYPHLLECSIFCTDVFPRL